MSLQLAENYKLPEMVGRILCLYFMIYSYDPIIYILTYINSCLLNKLNVPLLLTSYSITLNTTGSHFFQ